MMKPADADRISRLRQQTDTATDQLIHLADAARRELILLVCDSKICSDGAEKALRA